MHLSGLIAIPTWLFLSRFILFFRFFQVFLHPLSGLFALALVVRLPGTCICFAKLLILFLLLFHGFLLRIINEYCPAGLQVQDYTAGDEEVCQFSQIHAIKWKEISVLKLYLNFCFFVIWLSKVKELIFLRLEALWETRTNIFYSLLF